MKEYTFYNPACFRKQKLYKVPMRKISKPKIEKSDAAPATRRRLLDLLKRGGGQSSSDLGAALGVTAMAARLQLYVLAEEGLVRADAAPSGRGRPTKVWTLTDAAARVFPDAHQGLAVGMIASVESLFGAEGLAKIVDAHGERQRIAYAERLLGAKTLGEKVRRLAAARTDEGYMAEAARDGKDWLLVENHCPICSAAKACTRLCANELAVFADVLGPEVLVTREEHILAGARRCAYRVRAGKGR